VNKKKLKKYNLKRLKCILAINKKMLNDIKKTRKINVIDMDSKKCCDYTMIP